jgi:hypothetical protein
MEIHPCTKSRKDKSDTEKTNAELRAKYDTARARINRKGA